MQAEPITDLTTMATVMGPKGGMLMKAKPITDLTTMATVIGPRGGMLVKAKPVTLPHPTPCLYLELEVEMYPA